MKNKIKPVGTVPEKVEIDFNPPVKDSIKYLRSLPKNEGETFPWPLVEKFINYSNGENEEFNVKRYNTGQYFSDLPEPKEGYIWVWVSSMTKLTGHAGWLEVDVKNKRQGTYNRVCIS